MHGAFALPPGCLEIAFRFAPGAPVQRWVGSRMQAQDRAEQAELDPADIQFR